MIERPPRSVQLRSALSRTAAAHLIWSTPAAAVVALSALLAWKESGSIAAADWLPYAVFAALLLAAVLASGRALAPTRAGLVGTASLAALAAWTAISLTWSPLPEQARNDALLAALYALVLFAGLVAGGSGRNRAVLIGVVAVGLAAVAIATELKLVFAGNPGDLYVGGRLFFPIGYWNAQAAMFLIGFWPAVALAAHRAAPVLARSLCGGAAAALLAGAVLVQSKGAAIAFAVSLVAVLAVARSRLRLLVVVLLTVVPVAAAYLPLTRPYRASSSAAAYEHSIRVAGVTALLVAGGVAVAVAIYALADRRIAVSARIRRALGAAAAAALLAGLVAGAATFFVSVDHPEAWVREQWETFKHLPTKQEGSSHFVSLGSNRYDFWRVALDDFRHHPLAGIGQHGFAASYLVAGRSSETPQRAHSVYLDQLSETGIVGFMLLAVGIAAPLVVIVRRSRNSLVYAGVLGTALYWLVHTGGDWIWSFPAVGIPFFFLLGTGAARQEERTLGVRVGLPAALLPAAVAVFAFVPPWLAARFTDQALAEPFAQARQDLRRARWLDPLAVEPLVAQSEVARSHAAAAAALRRAVDLEPRDVTYWYLLGIEEARAGRRARARRALLAARRLYPRDDVIAQALARVRKPAEDRRGR